MIRALVLAGLFVGAAFQQVQDAPGSVDGTLKNASTGVPIAGATITLESPAAADRTVLSTTTSADGRFLFEKVPPSLYRVYTPRPHDLRPEQGGGPKTIRVSNGQKLTIELARLSPGVISGRILNARGNPLAGVRVEALQVLYRGGRAMLSASLNTTRTDDRGEYRLSVPPGDYYIQVLDSPPPFQIMGTFFPGTADFSKAQMVSAKPGGETSRVDFSSVSLSAMYRISGSVLGLPTGLAGQVNLLPVDRPASLDLLRASAQPDGTFEISGVFPGAYDLFATATPPPPPVAPPLTLASFGARSAPQAFGRVRVTLPPQDLSGVVIPMVPGIPVSGRVTFSGDVPPPSAPVYLSLATDELPVTLVPNMGGPIAADGSFAFTNLPPSRYNIKFSGLPEDFHIADFKEGGRSILSQGLRIDNTPPGPLELIIKSPGAIVEGVVRDAEQKGVPYTSAILIPEKELRWNLDLQKTVITDGEGRFAFRGVAPGSYKVFAWAEKLAVLADGTSELPDSFIAQFEESGSPVNVTEAEFVQEIRVRLISRKP